MYTFTKEKLEFLRSFLTYDPDTGVFRRKDGRNRKTKPPTDRQRAKTYKQIKVEDGVYYAHILAWWFMTEKAVPEGFEIDHRDRDRWNCSWSNLRLVTSGRNKNNASLRLDNKSGVTGVGYRKSDRVWFAHLRVDNYTHYLGRFQTKAEAIKARLAAEQKVLGEVVSTQAYAILRELEES